jgi:hypothetical protein
MPLLLTGVIAALFVLPTVFKKPGHDLIYATCIACYDYDFKVTNGRLEIKDWGYTRTGIDDVRGMAGYTLYRYDIDAHTSKSLTLEEVQSLKLSEGNKSPDGYSIERGNIDAYNPFFGGGYSDYSTMYAVNGASKVKLSISESDYGRFQEIGWVISE